jgi:hypothetical protein
MASVKQSRCLRERQRVRHGDRGHRRGDALAVCLMATGEVVPHHVHVQALSLHFMHNNFYRKHQTLKTFPAVAAGIERHPWSLTQLVEVLEEWERREA